MAFVLVSELGRPSQGRDTVLPMLPSLQIPAARWESPGPSLTSDQLVTDLGIPVDSLRFDNLLEHLAEFRKVLYFWLQFYYREGIQIGTSQGRDA